MATLLIPSCTLLTLCVKSMPNPPKINKIIIINYNYVYNNFHNIIKLFIIIILYKYSFYYMYKYFKIQYAI